MSGLHHPDLGRDHERPGQQTPPALVRAAVAISPSVSSAWAVFHAWGDGSLEQGAGELLRARPLAGVAQHDRQAADAQLLVVAQSVGGQ